MKLYHGSKNGNLKTIKKMQAQAGEGIEVPEDELKEGIYLTPHYKYALAMAARPDGVTYINHDNNTIEFGNPKLFDPEMNVFIYEIEVEEGVARQFDENQLVIEDLDEIKPTEKHTIKAGELEKYFELTNWNKEAENESSSEFKIK